MVCRVVTADSEENNITNRIKLDQAIKLISSFH